MENTDYFSPRRSGYGFSKRNTGVRADLTRSSQYVFNGLAFQISNKFLRFSYFNSESPRDAIINKDLDSFSSLIVMQPRLAWGINQDSTKIYSNLLSSVTEKTIGWNARIGDGANYVGVTFYRSLYDKYVIPMPIETILGSETDLNPEYDTSDFDDYSGDAFYLTYITNSADAEIAAMDSSEAVSELWEDAQSFFRVRGFDFSTVLGNIAVAGEYGEMMKNDNLFGFGSNPSAIVLNAYTQFSNLNFLILLN